MHLTSRQAKILQSLVEEYIDSASPISSELLKQRLGLDISPATIRNELQALAESGYLAQPHTSAGRVPTNKGYQFFIEITFADPNKEFPEFLKKEIKEAKQKIDQELAMAKELVASLEEISKTLNEPTIHQKEEILEILEMLAPSRTTYDKNIILIRTLLSEFENF